MIQGWALATTAEAPTISYYPLPAFPLVTVRASSLPRPSAPLSTTPPWLRIILDSIYRSAFAGTSVRVAARLS